MTEREMNEGESSMAPLAPTPVPGTAAYWAAQREAFALIEDWQTTDPDDPWAELAALRRIAAHPSAAGVMHARGRDFVLWISELEAMEDERFRSRHAEDAEDDQPETQPKGDDWCPRGCQPLYHLGECGMCGYEGRGVAIGATQTVVEYCCHCRCHTYQSHDGICQRCSRDAEAFGPIEPAAPITGSGAGTGPEQGPGIPACPSADAAPAGRKGCPIEDLARAGAPGGRHGTPALPDGHDQPLLHSTCACGAEAVDSDGQCCLCGYLDSRAALAALDTPADLDSQRGAL